MMYVKRYFGFIFVFLNVSFLFAQTVPVIDVSKDYPYQSIKFQDIADVKYVPLETSNNVLLDGRCKIFHVSDNYIIVSNPRQGDIFVFRGNGKIKYRFNHRGQGPEEYFDAQRVIFDETNREIFIYATKITNVFLVYSEDGKYKRTIKLPSWGGYGLVESYNFDDENLLVYEKYTFGDYFEEKPYMLLSKKDGTVSLLNITFPKRYSGVEVRGLGTDSNGELQGGVSVFFNDSNNRHYGQDFIIADISCDTVFQLKRDKSLTPIFRRTPSVHNSANQKLFLTYFLKTDKYVLMNLYKKNDASGGMTYSFMYDSSNGEINEVAQRFYFRSNDFPLLLRYSFISEVTAPKNTLVYKIEAMHLYEQRKEVKGELQKIASTIDAEDNPILMIAKFK